jgi:hypothetical protein
MIARAVDDAERRLHDLRVEEVADGALALVAVALAMIATSARPELALPLLVGGVFVGSRAVIADLRRWSLLDRLATEPDAYVIAEVRTRAESQATMKSRRSLSRTIETRLELGGNPRVVAAGDDLAALASDLADELLDLDPACAVACAQLLHDASSSPLINLDLPAEDIRSRITHIRAGFHRTGSAPRRAPRSSLGA